MCNVLDLNGRRFGVLVLINISGSVRLIVVLRLLMLLVFMDKVRLNIRLLRRGLLRKIRILMLLVI